MRTFSIRIIRFYLVLLPFFGLFGVWVSILRLSGLSVLREFILAGFILDAFVILFNIKKALSFRIFVALLLLFVSALIGLINENTLDRRFITDLIVPVFFFIKILIYKEYWKKADFMKFTKYFSKIAIWGSLILMPIMYIQLSRAGNTRVSVFPPLELPFAAHMGNVWITLLIILTIVLYGKRAQLIGAFLTFIVLFRMIKGKTMIGYLGLFSLLTLGLFFSYSQWSKLPTVMRLEESIQGIFESDDRIRGLENISAGRDFEIETVTGLMEPLDYILGKGIGFTYRLNGLYSNEEIANVHFTPLALLSKYGLFFTLFVYYFLFSGLKIRPNQLKNRQDLTAYGVVFFVFIESFFSYALFFTPILPIALGYLEYKKND